MNTNTKIKRLQRRRKLRRQRSAFFLIMPLFVMMAHGAFSKQSDVKGEYNVISVRVKQGDTLWTIAQEYKPKGKDLRAYVYEIAANNGLDDCGVRSGQTIFVPVKDN